MNEPTRPSAWARYLHPAETAEETQEGRHCRAPLCREPVTVYFWYYPRRSRLDGQPIGQERFLCGQHGAEFSARHGLVPDAAPTEPILHPAAGRVRDLMAPARLERMDADAVADFAAHGWRCDRRRCGHRCTYSAEYTIKSTPARRVWRFLCDRHAALLAARNQIDLATVPVAHGAFR